MRKIIAIIVMLSILSGCAIHTVEAESAVDDNFGRFTLEICDVNIRIITDTKTGVQYLAYVNSFGVGMTVLQEGDNGKK